MRLVSPLERLFIASAILHPPFCNQLVIEGVGELSVVQLQRALDQCSAANPGSTLRLIDRGEPLRWQSGPLPRLTRICAPDWDGTSDDGAAFLRTPLDPDQGPTCEVMCVTARDTVTRLIFRSLHAVMDGIGTLLWASDFMAALRHEAVSGHSGTIGDVDLAQRLVPGRTRARPQADALHPLGRPGPWDRREPFHWRRIMVPHQVDSHVLAVVAATLNRLARQHAENDHAALHAKVRFNIPCDLRRHDLAEKSTGNLFGPLFVEMPTDAPSHQFGLQLIRQMYERQELIPLNFLAHVAATSLDQWREILRQLLEQQHRQARYVFSATLSHLGRLTRTAWSCPDFVATSAYFVPPLADQVCFVACNGFDRHTEITIALPPQFCHDDGLAVLAKQIRAGLGDDLVLRRSPIREAAGNCEHNIGAL